LELAAEFRRTGRRDLLLHGQPIAWEDAPAPLALLVIEDVTARRQRMEQELALVQERAARAEAEAANRTKDEFLAMLAHELRNPLAPLRNVLQLLRRTCPDGPQETQLLDVGERQVRHMARLLEDLLDVSRVSRGKIELKKERVDVAGMVARVTDTVRQSMAAVGHDFQVHPPAEPIWLEVDPIRMEQLLINLLHNAVKYTPRGGRIDFSAAWEQEAAVFRVRDNGIGIAPEMLPRVFDLFTQAERTLDRSQGGLGIGLTLVKKLVELHGGTVQAASAGPGQGSEFTVRLPGTRGQLLVAAAERPASAAFAVRRVLVVDDNQDALHSLALLLQLEGHQVETAADGPTAIAAAQAHLPEVVFLDIGLPGMDGYEVARRLRQLPGAEEILLVALTGYGQEEDRRRSFQCGFNEHLVKALHPGRTAPAARRREPSASPAWIMAAWPRSAGIRVGYTLRPR